MKRPKIDQQTLDIFRKEAERLQKIELGVQSEGGKEMIAVIKEGQERTLTSFLTRDIAGLSDAMVLEFFGSVRGKLQLCSDILRYFENSGEEKQKLVQELTQYQEKE